MSNPIPQEIPKYQIMKSVLFTICCFLLIGLTVMGQSPPPPYNGRPDIRMDKSDDYSWTIWFTMNKPSKEFEGAYDASKCVACDSLKYHHNNEWVQSYFDSAEAYQYYYRLRHTGKVLMWKKYECGVDTASVWIDKYSISLHLYLQIPQPHNP